MTRLKWLRRECHNLALYFTLCLDENAFAAELKRLGIVGGVSFVKNAHSDATTHFLASSKDRRHCAIVCMQRNHHRTIEQRYGLLTHEAVHVWQEHCSLIGEGKPSSEYEAYGIQHIAQELMQAYAAAIKKPRKRCRRSVRR